ncbi:Prenyltransferase and squalene oxidase repeat protein [Rubripirellula obstinata]|uniref:Geranylgeranyl transferase type II subunit beta n=1 Tax=Rubripirellula obstinata TaxID=406547 RepID=A0A5B1CM78_9BACT|nr:prenyltransferase/squalene oxidase repeat-containing protein [Rubripirellula obstinata]KAA1261646.1 Prenyltransferase and squalene oxidase repeat protein [Rubripirellula obstinata]
MSNAPYLHELTLRLAIGAATLDPELKSKHGDWLVAQQRPDGGFAGREGESDPYYTAFALRGLWILDRIDADIARRSAEFLRGRMQKRDSIIDLISLIFAAAICELSVGEVVLADDDDWRINVARLLGSLRTEDGGFAKTPEGRAGSTYQTFLSVLCLELIDQPIKNPELIESFLASQSHIDGGYREIRAAKRPGVNPTAAAIGTLKTLCKLTSDSQSNETAQFNDTDQFNDTAQFIAEMQSDEGGLTANTRIPFADLLSSFTGLLTLTDLQASQLVNVNAIERYALSMQMPDGGFAGFSLDQTADVEYTFYGLATLSLAQTIS